MSTFTLYELINNKEVSIYYSNAGNIWKEMLSKVSPDNTDDFVELLEINQSNFENSCGGRNLGKEIMAMVAIGQFYRHETGFDHCLDEVIKVRDAIIKSNCSLEVKWNTEKACAIFGLSKRNYPDIEDINQ